MDRISRDHALTGEAAEIPVGEPMRVTSVCPVVLPAPGRLVNLGLKISAPVAAQSLPTVLLSHGQGRSNHLSSMNGYDGLAHFWAARGFVVVQPTT